MSATTHAPKQLDPSASLHPETLGLAPGRGRLAGRKIIVVGAGQRKIVDEEPPIGNGRAMSVLFAREGAHVACIDVNKEAADNTVAQIASEGGKAFTDVVDVADAAAIAPAVERCAQKLGGLDGLALNVGISCGLSLAEDDGGSLGPRLCGQRAQPHAVCAEGADDDGAGRRDRADLIDGEPARQWPQPGL